MSALNPPTSAADRVRALPNSIYIVSLEAGDVLVNSPPETLKYLLVEGLQTPRIILLPPDIPPGQELGSSGFIHQGINYASVEFPIYSNFFGNGQRTCLVTVSDDQARRIRQVLTETINGPADPAAYGAFTWLTQECAAISYYPALGRSPRIDDMVEIVSLESGPLPDQLDVRLEDEQFIFREHGVDVAAVSTQVSDTPLPLALTPPRPLLRQELTLQFIGGSDGFDPSGITTCFLAYLGPDVAQATLFDAAAYLCVRLGSLGISPNQISELVLSHLHEDHMAGLPEMLLMWGHRIRLVTSTIIYAGLLRVLSALLAVPEAEVAALFDYHPLNPGQALELEGRRFEAIYAVHSIPTIAVRVRGLCYSGDMRYDEDWFADLEARGVISAQRRSELIHFAEGTDILVQDVGGGPIHSTLTPDLLQALTTKSRRIVLAHTSKHALPTDQPDLVERVEFADSGHVVALGEVLSRPEHAGFVETLSVCPLFVRLSLTERVELAEVVELTDWNDGQVIVNEGELSNQQTYVVHSGLVDVSRQGKRLLVLGRGTCIGERGALQGQHRIATMLARGHVQLLRLKPEVFLPIAEHLGLSASFSRADWLSHHPAFSHIPWSTLLDLGLDFQPRAFSAGTRLFAAGELGDEGYLLISGAIAIHDAAGHLLAEYTHPGDFFGGRAALYAVVRDASATTTQTSEVWALPAAALQRLYMTYPNVLFHLRVVKSYRHGD